MKKFINSYKFPLLLLSSVILGSLVGLFFKSSVVYLKPFGEIFLNMMYTVVVPLVFFTISSSIANMINLKRLGKILYTVFFVFFIMSAVAAIYMIVVTYIFNPVNASISLESGTSETINLSDQIVKALTVTDFNLILSRSNMLPLIVFSILFGIATSLTKSNTVKKFLDEASNINMKIVKIIMYYAPIGLFSYFASLTSSYGSELLGSYAKAMIIYYLATIVFFFVFYTIYAYIAGGKKYLDPTLTMSMHYSKDMTVGNNTSFLIGNAETISNGMAWQGLGKVYCPSSMTYTTNNEILLFLTAPTGDLLTWLNTNATKI